MPLEPAVLCGDAMKQLVRLVRGERGKGEEEYAKRENQCFHFNALKYADACAHKKEKNKGTTSVKCGKLKVDSENLIPQFCRGAVTAPTALGRGNPAPTAPRTFLLLIYRYPFSGRSNTRPRDNSPAANVISPLGLSWFVKSATRSPSMLKTCNCAPVASLLESVT